MNKFFSILQKDQDECHISSGDSVVDDSVSEGLFNEKTEIIIVNNSQ